MLTIYVQNRSSCSNKLNVEAFIACRRFLSLSKRQWTYAWSSAFEIPIVVDLTIDRKEKRAFASSSLMSA